MREKRAADDGVGTEHGRIGAGLSEETDDIGRLTEKVELGGLCQAKVFRCWKDV